MKKILIVEDNELNMKLFFDILTYQKYDVDKAFDGEIGLQKILNNKYDLILLDIQLPKLSGFEILNKLKKENVSLPKIIIVSAFASDKDKLKARTFEVDTYLTKPIDINNFINTVKKSLEE